MLSVWPQISSPNCLFGKCKLLVASSLALLSKWLCTHFPLSKERSVLIAREYACRSPTPQVMSSSLPWLLADMFFAWLMALAIRECGLSLQWNSPSEHVAVGQARWRWIGSAHLFRDERQAPNWISSCSLSLISAALLHELILRCSRNSD